MKFGRWPLAALAVGMLALPDARAGARLPPTAPAEYLSKKNALAGNAAAIEKGAKLYERRCVKCHGPKGDGKGKSAEGIDPPVPDFTTGGYFKARNEGQLFWMIEKGSPNTDMDSFGPGTQFNLSPDDIWSVVAYLHSKFGGAK